MKKRLSIKNSSLSTKIFIAFLLVIIPIYLLSVEMITIGKNEVRKEIVEGAYSKLDLYLSSLENEFYNIRKLEDKLINDRDILKLSRIVGLPNNYDEYSSYYSIQDKLKDIEDVSKYVVDAKVYIMSQGKQISPGQVSDYSNTDIIKLKKAITDKSYPFAYIDNKIYIIITPYYFYPYEGADINPKFIISIEVSEAEMKKQLKEFFNNEQGEALLLGNIHGLSLTNNGDEKIIPVLQKYLVKNKDEIDSHKTDSINVGKQDFIINIKKSETLNSSLIILVSKEKFFDLLTTYNNWIWVISLLTLITVIIFSLWIKSIVIKPIDKLIGAFKMVETGESVIAVDYKNDDEFGYLYKSFNEMCRKLSILIKQVYEEKLHAKSAELKQLQYQINPHFLYNCFFLTYRMAMMHDEDGVINLTKHLGNYYQFVTRSSSDDVLLIKEVNHIKDYIEIQSVRFNNRICVQIEELPKALENVLVPRLILQPVVENAYSHGLKNKIKDGIINISFYQSGNVLSISVEDNGEELTSEILKELEEKLLFIDKSSEITGLLNVQRRLIIKYGEQAGISVSRGELGGLLITEKIILKED